MERGCPAALAAAEVGAAENSPYLAGAAVLRARLGKRDWLLNSYHRLASLEPTLNEVPVRHAPPAEHFFRDHYATNRPVVLTGLVDHWPARAGWSLDRLAALPGDRTIEVQTGRESDPAYEQRSDSHRTMMPLAALIERLRGDEPSNDFYVTANNGTHNRQALAPLWEDLGPISGYLVDDPARDGFLWIGPAGTITPFHHDLTNNLLVQIKGRKRVTLVPPWDTPLMRNHAHCYSSWSGPQELQALPDGQRPALLTCTIGPGDALFLPVGWWHHVEALDMTMGMSFINFARANDFYAGYDFYGTV